MAKLLLSFLFFFFIAISHARDLIDRSENEIPIQDSDSKASILLPSEKLFQSESESETSESKSSEISETLATAASPEEETETNSQPLIMITFSPIDREFPRRSLPRMIFRRGRHRCHHHNHHHHHDGDREISYDFGNDMILSDEQSNINLHGEIPLRMNRLRHVGPWESYGSDRKKLHHHHHFHHHHEDVEEKEAREEEEEKHEEKSGFLGHFRKFLNQFEF